MVTAWIIDALTSVFVWFVGILPGLPSGVSGFFDSGQGAVDSFAGVVGPYLNVLAYWQPVALIGLILAAWLLTWPLSVFIKIVRMAMSLFTGGGGNVG